MQHIVYLLLVTVISTGSVFADDVQSSAANDFEISPFFLLFVILSIIVVSAGLIIWSRLLAKKVQNWTKKKDGPQDPSQTIQL